MKHWFMATRPQTLIASVAPILLSQVLAFVGLDHSNGTGTNTPLTHFGLVALLAMGCALCLQVAVNLGNDYFDHFSGVDNAARLGPTRVDQPGALTLGQLKGFFLVSLSVGVALGIWLVILSSVTLLGVGVLCVLAVLTYTSGPFPLAYIALGELAVFIIFGPIAVMGGYYAQHLALPNILWLPAIQMGFLASAIMLTNNIRDMASDALAGKRTLAHLLGETLSKHLYRLFIVASALSGWLLVNQSGLIPGPLWLLLPWAFWLVVQVGRREGAALNLQLAQTAQFMLFSSVLLCVELVYVG